MREVSRANLDNRREQNDSDGDLEGPMQDIIDYVKYLKDACNGDSKAISGQVFSKKGYVHMRLGPQVCAAQADPCRMSTSVSASGSRQ